MKKLFMIAAAIVAFGSANMMAQNTTTANAQCQSAGKCHHKEAKACCKSEAKPANQLGEAKACCKKGDAKKACGVADGKCCKKGDAKKACCKADAKKDGKCCKKGEAKKGGKCCKGEKKK